METSKTAKQDDRDRLRWYSLRQILRADAGLQWLAEIRARANRRG